MRESLELELWGWWEGGEDGCLVTVMAGSISRSLFDGIQEESRKAQVDCGTIRQFSNLEILKALGGFLPFTLQRPLKRNKSPDKQPFIPQVYQKEPIFLVIIHDINSKSPITKRHRQLDDSWSLYRSSPGQFQLGRQVTLSLTSHKPTHFLSLHKHKTNQAPASNTPTKRI